MSGRQDVLVIGGGVIGVCSAYYLAKGGCRVTLIDRDDVCAGASWGNAGLICPSHVVPMPAPGVIGQALEWMWDPTSPFYIKPRLDASFVRWLVRFALACNRWQMMRSLVVLRELADASSDLYRELEMIDGLSFGMKRDGLLYLYRDPRAYASGREEARLLARHGIRSTILDAAGAQRRLPGLGCTALGGVFYPDDAHLDPGALVHGLAGVVSRMGVDIRQSTEVLGFEVHGRRVAGVRTTRGEYRPEHVVLAAGAWSSTLVRDLGIDLPIEAAKGYSVTFERPGNSPPVPMLLGETRVAVTPLPDALRLGGTLELAGIDLTINQPRIDAILKAARAFLPGLESTRALEIWRGLRPCTPDGLPVIGACKAYENLIIAAGHGTLGITLGPVTGHLVSHIVLGQPPTIDPGALSVERFGG